MYEEINTRRPRGLASTLLLILVAILLLVLGMIIIFPTKASLEPLYQNIFRDNLNSMKDAAETYFTNERLPKELNKSEKLTLAEMLDKNLVLPFVDKDGKQCNINNSYVEITKVDNEYELKVKLICGDYDAYIIEHLGCTDKCESDSCKPEKIETVMEYQFKQEKSIKTIIGYTCDDGYSLAGNICVKRTKTTKDIDATPIYEEGSLSEEPEIKQTEITSCDEGWTKQNNMCVQPSKTKNEVEKYCSDGTLNDDKTLCLKNATKTTTKTYTCPTGWNDNGTSCTKAAISTKEATGYNNWVYYTSTKSTEPLTTYTNDTEKMVSDGSDYERDCEGCARTYYYYYIIYRRTATYTTKYSCSQGTLSGTICTLPRTVKENVVYTCPNNWEKTNDNECSIASSVKNVTKNYCDNGALTADKTLCTKDLNKLVKTEYICDTDKGWVLNGTKCIKKNEAKIIGYKCPADYEKYNTKECRTYVTKIDTDKATPKYKTSTSIVYTWARTKTLKGWTATGETRTITK